MVPKEIHTIAVVQNMRKPSTESAAAAVPRARRAGRTAPQAYRGPAPRFRGRPERGLRTAKKSEQTLNTPVPGPCRARSAGQACPERRHTAAQPRTAVAGISMRITRTGGTERISATERTGMLSVTVRRETSVPYVRSLRYVLILLSL